MRRGGDYGWLRARLGPVDKSRFPPTGGKLRGNLRSRLGASRWSGWELLGPLGLLC